MNAVQKIFTPDKYSALRVASGDKSEHPVLGLRQSCEPRVGELIRIGLVGREKFVEGLNRAQREDGLVIVAIQKNKGQWNASCTLDFEENAFIARIHMGVLKFDGVMSDIILEPLRSGKLVAVECKEVYISGQIKF